MAGQRRTEQEWREVLDLQRNSGLSIQQYCVDAGVSQQSFYKWRKKLGEPSVGKRPGAGSVRRVDREENGFVALKLLESSSSLELVHPQGCVVRVTGEVNAAALQQVLSVLDGRGKS